MLKGNLYFSDYITEAMKEPREREKEQEQIPRSYTNAPPPPLPPYALPEMICCLRLCPMHIHRSRQD